MAMGGMVVRMTLARCFEDGYLVGMDRALPMVESEYFIEGGAFVGCGQVKCDRCQQRVRHIDHRMFAAPLAAPERDALYDSLDAASPLVTAGAGGDSYRLYLCRCTYAAIAGVRCLAVADEPWRCAGHPVAEPDAGERTG